MGPKEMFNYSHKMEVYFGPESINATKDSWLMISSKDLALANMYMKTKPDTYKVAVSHHCVFREHHVMARLNSGVIVGLLRSRAHDKPDTRTASFGFSDILDFSVQVLY
jgi:hypothetical protein